MFIENIKFLAPIAGIVDLVKYGSNNSNNWPLNLARDFISPPLLGNSIAFSSWGHIGQFEKEKGGHTCNDPEQVLGNRNAQTYQYHFQTPLSSRYSCAKNGNHSNLQTRTR
jgi:hypothetical protein